MFLMVVLMSYVCVNHLSDLFKVEFGKILVKLLIAVVIMKNKNLPLPKFLAPTCEHMNE